MKRNILYIILIALCIIPPHNLRAQTVTHYNSVKTIAPTVVTSSSTNLTVDNSITTYQYFDDLGRPFQTVGVGTSPAKRDMVTYQEYDAAGRESLSWLPVSLSTSGNNGKPVSLSTVQSRSASLYGDSKAYSKPVYDGAPLGRISEQYGPGQDWHNNNKRVKTEYLENTASGELACRWYRTTDTRTTVQISVQAGKEYYPAYTLSVVRITDEDGTGITLEFHNKRGQVLLTRQVVSGTTYQDTYYVYDSYGNQRAVLPPAASDLMTTTGSWTDNTTGTDVLSLYAYLYKYDDRNRCTEKKLPGTGWMKLGYDRSNRLTYTQDGEQAAKSPGLCTFYLYDAYNRPVVEGICQLAGSIAYLGSSMMVTTLSYGTNGYISSTGIESSGYSPNMSLYIPGLHTVEPTVHTVNYYDNYKFKQLSGFNHSSFTTPASPNSGKGKLTGTVTSLLLENNNIKLYTVYYYDAKGRLEKTIATNNMGGFDTTTTTYTFTGKPSTVTHTHTATGKTTQTQVYGYTYDHADRLKTVTHKLNSGSTVTLTNNTYNELGQLISNKRNGQTALTNTYTYNVRSWLKSSSNPLFSQTLYYNDTYSNSTPCYNGNISAMSWAVSGEKIAGSTTTAKTRGYKFTYDNLSRLTAANYLENAVAKDYFNTSYTYDKQGNIKTLTRRGNTGTSTYGVIDNLTMTYSGNQLTKAEDTVTGVSLSASMDFRNNTNVAQEYVYDKNGNLTKDLNKGISNISYNALNLPRSLTISNTFGSATNTYVYAADGRKVSTHISGKGTDYCGNVIYENDALKRILFDGGYIEGGTYYFYLTDHQGNVRVVANASGTVVQSNHYYPFGMSFTEGTQTSSQPYKYSGKELDTQKGLNWYDSQARMYDPALGRFTTMDPLAEEYYSWSSYSYCLNNPVKFVDPDGKFVGTVIGGIFGGIAGGYRAYKEGRNVLAGAAEGAVSGAITGATVDLAVGSAVATGGGSLIVLGIGAAAGGIGGAGGAIVGDVVGQVVEQIFESPKENIEISTENFSNKAVNGAIAGAVGGVASGIAGNLGKMATTSTKSIQQTMSNNINSTATVLGKMGASAGTTGAAVNQITKGMGEVGKNTTNSIWKINAGTSSITEFSLKITEDEWKQ
ncbi:DUF6443 domain-containing protein [Bacteroides sp. UBA939]|uniref:DUF6443 domain-containing protein n=1 Tax=Bacteroides sp. UBA939 TaxID=1946092 RepID=UPI0025B901C4|nr:DUF6443 domain-containing protein [Bacteroides sp. UBA939]